LNSFCQIELPSRIAKLNCLTELPNRIAKPNCRTELLNCQNGKSIWQTN
jgi:hypothetical protein